MKTGKDTRTNLQKKFEEQTPTIKGLKGLKYLQTYCSWLELQIEKTNAVIVGGSHKGIAMDNSTLVIDGTTIVHGSWLDSHVLNEDSIIDGTIIKHHAKETCGGVAITTFVGNFAIVKEDQEKAAKNIGKKVKVQPHKDYYGTVVILSYLNEQ